MKCRYRTLKENSIMLFECIIELYELLFICLLVINLVAEV